LLCKSTSWVCDTIEVWQKGRSTEFPQVLSQELINHLKEGARLIVTGGEPLMQQYRLQKYLQWLKVTYRLDCIIEIETNGTIVPQTTLQLLIDQWNVSFKLSNSGEPWSRRGNELALRWFNHCLHANFKIVVSSEEDVLEIINDYGSFIDLKKVTLMPAGDDIEKLEDVRTLVIELCKKYYFRYSDRLHIVAWNKKTGV
jgi:organic radical activating enzyme